MCERATYFFFVPFEEGFAFEGAGFAAGVVFFADAGLDARCRFEEDGLAFAALVFFVVAVLTVALFNARGRGSVFRAAEAATSAGAEAACLAASRQFGKKSSIRWREMELARRQRGQCAS